MSFRRVGVLFRKETSQGTRNFLFIFAIVTPIVVSLVLSLVFGDIFSQKPKLGFVTAADSQLVSLATALDSVSTQEFSTESQLKEAVERGALDMGVVLPAEFDALVSNGDTAPLTAYIWGESLAQNRAILGVTLASLVREMTGQEIPLDIVITPLGDAEAIPWEDRLLPFLVLMAVVIGGTMVPASSLVNEKQEGTLTALTITPSTLSEVFLAKGVLGILISTLMGVLILILNQAFVSERLLLVVVLALGATLAASFGVLLGALTKDVTTLFATIKGIGLLLYAPALIYLFPTLPQWIARIFPTYYIIGPVIEIVQNGGTWSDVALDVLILVLLILGIMALLLLISQRSRRVAYA
jgi:ABC-2 type transport system permease protein